MGFGGGLVPPLVAELKGDISDFHRKMGEAGADLDKLASKGQTTGQKLSAGIKQYGTAAGTAMATVGGVLTKLASDEQDSMARLKAAANDAGVPWQKVDGYIDSSRGHMEHLGYTVGQTADAFAKALTATGNYGDATKIMSVAADLAREKNVSLSDAVGMLVKAAGGSTKSLKDLGINTATFAKTAEQATKDLAKAQDHLKEVQQKIADGELKGKQAAKELADAQKKVKDADEEVAQSHDRLGQVVDAVGKKTHGVAEDMASTWGGKMRMVGADVENVAAAIGQKFGPALTGAGLALIGISQTVGGISKLVGWLRNLGAAEEAAGASAGVQAAETEAAAGEIEAAEAGVGASASAAGAEVGTATLGMGSAFGVLAAAIAGYQIGSVINRTFVAPVIKDIEHAHDIIATNTEDMKNRFVMAFGKMAGVSSVDMRQVVQALNSVDTQGKLTQDGIERLSGSMSLISQAAQAHIPITADIIKILTGSANDAASAVQDIQDKLNALHDKTITITTIDRTVIEQAGTSGNGINEPVQGMPSQHTGYVPSYHAGLDRLASNEYMAKLLKSEAVMNPRATSLFSPLLKAMNRTPDLVMAAMSRPAKATVGIAPSGGGPTVVNNYFSFPNYIGNKKELIDTVVSELSMRSRSNPTAISSRRVTA